MVRLCDYEGCGREHKARGFCAQHDRQVRLGLPLRPIKSRTDQGEVCQWSSGCKNKPQYRGFCQKHLGEYHQIRCSLEYCDNFAYAKGFCKAHYEQVRNGITLRPLMAGNVQCDIPGCSEMSWHYRSKRCEAHRNTCAVPGCENHTKNNRSEQALLCSMHLQRKRNGKDMDAPKNRQDGRYVNSNGYVLISMKDPRTRNGWILEHRWVMEQHLGRPLAAHETVHHINGNKVDNRLENLELWSKSQPAGQRVTDKAAWAREILSAYGTEEERSFFDERN